MVQCQAETNRSPEKYPFHLSL